MPEAPSGKRPVVRPGPPPVVASGRSRNRPWLAGIAAGVAIGHLALPAIMRLLTAGNYGLPVFVLVPLTLGFLSALLLGYWSPSTKKESAWSSVWALATVAVFLGVMLQEGAVCMVMAAPLLVPIAIAGSAVGNAVINALHGVYRRYISVSLVAGLPIALALSTGIQAGPQTHVHVTERVIDAPAERIWPLLFNLPDLPPPRGALLNSGIAYPLATRTRGSHRFCILSTGVMPERIEISEPAKRLRFRVESTPDAIAETNPFGEVMASHNSKSFRCIRGQFELIPRGRGTLVRATSWYEHDYAPDFYWTLWTDAVVAAVHDRVLSEIDRRTR